jgi:hypothetical protein
MNRSDAFPAARTENLSAAEPTEELPDRDRCSLLLAPGAAKIVKCRSNLARVNLFIAASASTQ